MATDNQYIPRHPGDLITAADWNNLQSKIKDDIGKQIKEAINNLTNVPSSENTHKIDNQTLDELTKAILEKARQELPLRTGYLRRFKMLSNKVETVIEHNLGAYPEVDIYELEKFEAICSEDGIKTFIPRDASKDTGVYFYLYQTDEQRITTTVKKDDGTDTKASAVIEVKNETAFRIPFHEMLAYYKIEYTDSSTLDYLETEFWSAFKEQNDKFEDDLICHSPWFDRCCGEERTVADLRQDWKHLWFKVKPRKTINSTEQLPKVKVRQFNLNTIGVQLTEPLVNGVEAVERAALIIMKV